MSELDKRVAISLEDGQVYIMNIILEQKPSIESPGWKKELTTEVIENEVARASRVWDSPVKSWRVIGLDELPKNRLFRSAWVDDGYKIGHDLDKARAIHLDRMRYHRGVSLEELDRKWMRATGQGKKKEAAEIEKKRQALRDIPVTLKEAIDSAKTPEEITSVWHEYLPDNPRKYK
jgi:hypothetical protein